MTEHNDDFELIHGSGNTFRDLDALMPTLSKCVLFCGKNYTYSQRTGTFNTRSRKIDRCGSY